MSFSSRGLHHQGLHHQGFLHQAEARSARMAPRVPTMPLFGPPDKEAYWCGFVQIW
jgi:hypothetical protein